MELQRWLDELERRGWMDDNQPQDKCVLDFQLFWGLPETGKIDDCTIEALLKPRVCDNPDKIAESRDSGVRAWRDRDGSVIKNLSICIVNPSRWVTPQEKVLNSLHGAVREINEACGVTLKVISDRNSADILLRTGRIDGSGGTLAWSDLPPSNPCQQKYDSGERWGFEPRRGIYMQAVMIHEICHALGLEHFRGSTGNLMDARYDANVFSLQAGDFDELIKRYGVRSEPPQPPPVDPTPAPPDPPVKPVDPDTAAATVTIHLAGRYFAGKIPEVGS